MVKNFKLSGVYKITNKINGKFYVGSGNSVFGRWLNHASSLSNGNHTGYKLQRAFNKYGFENFNFEILELHPVEGLNLREQYYLDTLCKAQEYVEGTSNFFCNNTYNVKPNVYGTVGIPKSEEVIIRALRSRGYEQIYKVSLQGEFLEKYESQKQASEDNNISRSTVSSSIKRVKPPKGKNYYFTYKSNYDSNLRPKPYRVYNKGVKGITEGKNKIPVYCYDVYGRLYKKFESGIEVAKYFNTDPSSISRMLDKPKKKILHRTGVHLYNFYTEKVALKNRLDIFKSVKEDGPVEVYSLFHEFLGCYSFKTLSTVLNSKEVVVRSAVKKEKLLKGFYFSYL